MRNNLDFILNFSPTRSTTTISGRVHKRHRQAAQERTERNERALQQFIDGVTKINKRHQYDYFALLLNYLRITFIEDFTKYLSHFTAVEPEEVATCGSLNDWNGLSLSNCISIIFSLQLFFSIMNYLQDNPV